MIKLNGQEIEFSKFPNGETLVDIEVLNKAENGCRIDFNLTLKKSSSFKKVMNF